MITRVVLVNRHRGWKLSSKTLLKREATFQGGCLLYFQLMYLLNYWEHSLSWLLSTLQGGPKTHRDMHSTVTQLSGDECKEVVLVLRYSLDKALVKEKMKQHFSTGRMWLKTQPQPSLSWIFFPPRFLDTSGLVRHQINFWLLWLLYGSLLSMFFAMLGFFYRLIQTSQFSSVEMCQGNSLQNSQHSSNQGSLQIAKIYLKVPI